MTKKKKYTLEDIIQYLGLSNKKQKSDSHAYGQVTAINSDGSYQVSLDGGASSIKCARLVGAAVGDTVFVTILTNGFAVVTDRLKGDKDALDAKHDAAEALDEVGGSIVQDTLHYLAYASNTGVTTDTPGWTPTPQTITTDKPYLWIYHTYTTAAGDTIDTTPVVSGARGTNGTNGRDGTDGEDGTDGKSVAEIQTQYYLSTSDQSATGGSWSWNPQTFIHGRYYWTREYIEFSDGSHDYSTAVYNAALTDANETAWDAKSIAEGIEQHFWTQDGTGTEAGAHITEYPQDEWTDPNSQNYHKGGDVLLKSVGLYIRIAAQVLASFLTDGIRLFSSSGNLLASFLSTGLDVYDGAGHTIAHLGYGPGASATGTADAPYYDFGIRASGTTIGNRSLIQGQECEASAVNCSAHGYHTKASGIYAFACGSYSEATNSYTFAANSGKASAVGAAAFNNGNAAGQYSAAFGSGTYANGKRSFAAGVGTEANGDNQAVFGRWNNPNSTDIFQIGDGTTTQDHNAFSIDDSGNMRLGDEAPITTFTATGSVASIVAGQEALVSCTGTVPTGYTPIAVAQMSSNLEDRVIPTAWKLTANGVDVPVRNEWASTARNISFTVTVLCVRSTMV